MLLITADLTLSRVPSGAAEPGARPARGTGCKGYVAAIKSSPLRRGRLDHPGCLYCWEPTGSTGAAASWERRTGEGQPGRRCKLQTRADTGMPDSITPPGTTQTAPCPCRCVPSEGTALSQHPPCFLASPTHNMTSLRVARAIPNSPLQQGGSRPWCAWGARRRDAPTQHPRIGVGSVAEHQQLVTLPAAVSLCLGVCGCLEPRLEVICLSPAAGCHLASANRFHLRCH